jgi:hypothetical protein
MMPQAGPHPLCNRFDQSFISRVHSALGHDMHGEFLCRARSLSIAERSEHDARDFTLIGGMAWRKWFRLHVRKIDIGRKHSDRGVKIVDINEKLTGDRLMMLELTSQLCTLSSMAHWRRGSFLREPWQSGNR